MKLEIIGCKPSDLYIQPCLLFAGEIIFTDRKEAILAIDGYLKSDDNKIISELKELPTEDSVSEKYLAARGTSYDNLFKERRQKVEFIVADLADVADGEPRILRRIERADVVAATADEVVGEFAVEVLLRVGGEGKRGAARGRAREFRTALDQRVEQRAVVGGDVLHVAHVLVATLDLEAADAGVDQRFEVGALVVVLHRQHMLVVRDDAPFHVGDLVRQSAGLRAVAAVGAAPGVGVADVALAAVGDAQRAVDEEFQGGLGSRGGADGGDLSEVELACEDDLGEPHVLQEAGFFRGADVGLGAGVQLDRRQVEFQQAHVLDDQRVDAGVIQLPDLPARRLQFVVGEDGVEGDEHARVEAVRMRHQSGNVGNLRWTPPRARRMTARRYTPHRRRG